MYRRSFYNETKRVIANTLVLPLSFAAFGFLCACSTPTIGPLSNEFTIAIEHAKGVPPGTFYLKPVPGGLLGKTVDDEMFRSPPGVKAVKVSAAALVMHVREHALSIRWDRHNPGELARPRDLGVARVGTFYEPSMRDDSCRNFRTGLTAGSSGSAMLVYVDGPGRIHGSRYNAPYIVDYRLDFPKAGIYVVAMQAQGIIVTSRIVTLAGALRATVRPGHCL